MVGVLFVDYDGDGKKDMFTASPASARVLRNTSTVGSGLSFVQTIYTLPSSLTNNGNTNSTIVYNSQGDIPAIADIDSDGDYDVLSYYVNTPCIRYNKNMSQELYGHSDSLIYKTVNVCYGKFSGSSFK